MTDYQAIKSIKNILDAYRKELHPNMTWDDLAEQAGMSPQGFYAALKRNDMTISFFVSVAKVLGVSSVEIFRKVVGERQEMPMILNDNSEPAGAPGKSDYALELEQYNTLLEQENEVLRKLVNRFKGQAEGKETKVKPYGKQSS